jgi:hypothetical protein
MSSIPFWPAVAAVVVLLVVVLVLKLRGSGRGDDLIDPRKRRKKRISPGEAGRLLALVEAGDEEGALRRIRELGYDEAGARKILAIVGKFEDFGKAGPGTGD